LLGVLATREPLESVTLWDDDDPEQRNSPERIAPFLLGIQRNPRVQMVGFDSLRLSGDAIASFLDSATSVTTLSLTNCVMEQAPGGALAVATALQRNTNIQRLELWDQYAMYMVPILNSLAFNSRVRELIVWIDSEALSLALKDFLESSLTIQQFELKGCRGESIEKDSFDPIAQGLIKNKSVAAVCFEECDFDSHEVVLSLNSILESKSNLQFLTLRDCIVHHQGRESFHAAIFGLLQPHSLLRSFELNCNNLSDYGFETAQDCARLLRAVETSPLERFSIGTIASRESCLELIASIPKMQLKTLSLVLDSSLDDMKGAIIQAVKRNASLLTCTVGTRMGNSIYLLNDDELNAYSLRNKRLARWIENPTLLPNTEWPKCLELAQTTGPDIVFRILLALAPSLGPLDGEKCQKRRRSDPPGHYCLGPFESEQCPKRLRSDPPGRLCYSVYTQWNM
jgi:hypothetical protein